MSIESYQLGRVRVATEPAGSFGVDIWAAGAGAASFLDVPLSEGSAQLTLTQNMLPPKPLQQYLDGKAQDVLGMKAASLQFSMELHATGVAANAATASITDTASALLRMLKAICGGLRGGNMGSAVATATSASQHVVTGGQGSRFTAGQGIVWSNPTTGLAELRELATVSTDTLTDKVAFSATPQVGNTIYNATTIYPAENPDTTLQFVVEGAENDFRWLLRGMIGGFTISLGIDDLWTITFNLVGSTWSNLGSGSLAAATYQNYAPVFGKGDFIAQATGTRTFNRVHVQSCTITPNFQYTPVKSYAGLEGIYRFRRKRAVPLYAIEFVTMFEDIGWFSARDARTDYCFTVQGGYAPGSLVGITLPAAQIEDVQPVNQDDDLSQKVVAHSRLDTDATDQSTEIRRAAGRIDFG